MASIRGNLHDSSHPIKDVDVTLRKIGGIIVNKTTTNDLGVFSLMGIDSGVYELENNKIVLPENEKSVNGQIAINSLPGKALEVNCYNVANEILGKVLTDDFGKYRFEGLITNEIKIVINLPVTKLSASQ